MNVRGIRIVDFMGHTKSAVTLPDSGVVVITGANGSGKSTLVEAVSVAFWDKTLRGTPWWHEGGRSQAEVETDAHRAKRTRTKKGTKGLRWERLASDADPVNYETTSKAQAALVAEVGEHDTWQRCSVFSSADAAHFTTATDAARKRLLERILDLDAFEPALKECRGDLAKARAAYESLDRVTALAESRREGAQNRLSDAAETLAASGEELDLDALRDELARLKTMIADCDRDLATAREQTRAADRGLAEARAALSSAEREANRLDRGECPTCGQEIPPELRERLRSAVAEARTQVEAATKAADAARETVEAEAEEVAEERASLREKAADVDGRGRAAAGAQRAREAAQRAQKDATAAIAKANAEIAEAESKLTEAKTLVAELEATERVLGLQGVRAHVLGRALDGIQVVANVWLKRIAGPGFRLKLRPYTEQKTAGIADKISLEVEGAGGGFGYRASSGGERRRIDVALLMALAEVARAARGAEPGTLWFDEVFDALDTDGVARVSDALAELSADRAVVVISHSETLVARLRPALHLHVEDGDIAATH